MRFNFLRRLVGRDVPCADPEHPECKRKHADKARLEEDELKRAHSEYVGRMEDEIAVMMRERENGH